MHRDLSTSAGHDRARGAACARRKPPDRTPSLELRRPAGAMTLFARVCAVLRERQVEHAVIGASALAAHGVARATFDLDLLVLSRVALDASVWATIRDDGAAVEIRAGDQDDPLAGVVRLEADGEKAVDVVVGRSGW